MPRSPEAGMLYPFLLFHDGTAIMNKHSIRLLLPMWIFALVPQRAGVNLLFTPVRRLEVGAELLWGERKNSDDTSGSASQLQLSVRYLY